jgi:uncharacterized membrane protein
MTTYCNFKGCTNKATVLSYSKEFKNDDGDGYWHVYVSVCDEHWDDLAPRQDFKPVE